MQTPRFLLLAALLTLLPAFVEAQTQATKFGTQWPSVGKCLAFSEETGAWGWSRLFTKTQTEDGKGEISMDAPKIVFIADGRFAVGWNESEKVINKYWRTKVKTESHMTKCRGRWRLEHRAATVQERTAMRLEKSDAFDGWFLDMIFFENELPAEYANYPALKDAKINGRMLLVLNEFQPFKKTPRAKPVYTTPSQMLWLIISNDLGGWIMPDTAATHRLMIMRHR